MLPITEVALKLSKKLLEVVPNSGCLIVLGNVKIISKYIKANTVNIIVIKNEYPKYLLIKPPGSTE